jgi:hypothetical protein
MVASRESTLLIGESRIGKSSILRQLGYLATASTSTVYFDGYVSGSPDRFAAHLGLALESAGGQLSRAAKAGQKGLYSVLRLLESLKDRLTILIDEVDGIVADKESARFIRSVASTGHKIIIATSRIDPSQHESHPDEPVWWNVFQVRYVGLFEEAEATEMLFTLSERSGKRFSGGECSFVIEVMGCFPFLLQWLGREVFRRGFRDCTTAERRQLLQELATDFEFLNIIQSHFTGWIERLDSRQTQLLLNSSSSRGISPHPAIANLKNRGLLVEDESGRWRPFSRLFCEFLQSVPKDSVLSDDVKAKLWQGLFPAIKTVFDVAAKHYL